MGRRHTLTEQLPPLRTLGVTGGIARTGCAPSNERQVLRSPEKARTDCGGSPMCSTETPEDATPWQGRAPLGQSLAPIIKSIACDRIEGRP